MEIDWLRIHHRGEIALQNETAQDPAACKTAPEQGVQIV